MTCSRIGLLICLLLACGLATTPAWAQSPTSDPEPVLDLRSVLGVESAGGWQAPLDPETGLVRRRTELTVAAMELEDGWLELTPLASEEPAALVRLGDRALADDELRMTPMVSDGVAMLCSGGRSVAVLCEQVYVTHEAWVATGQPSDLEIRFEPGLAVSGRYLLAGWAVAGARIAVVPVGIVSGRAFTMPLRLGDMKAGDSALLRQVVSDDEGRFELPRLAAGEYFLETHLPSGRVHRSSPFQLPTREQARLASRASESSRVVWELGEIDVADGLVVTFAVTDWQGEPLQGALVAARQGSTPSTLVNFETTTDDAGSARLSGLSAEQAVHISCQKTGYRRVERDEPLLPVLISCSLEPLARVAGEVIGIDGLPPADAVVSMIAAADEQSPAVPGEMIELAVDSDGRFVTRDLAAGQYRLTGAAPGFETATRVVTLEPGQRLQTESIILLFGRDIEARVVDAESRQPLVDVEVTAVSPPGAVAAVSDDRGQIRFADPGDDSLVLRLTAPEHASREIKLDADRSGQDEPLILEMERAGWIRVVVWDDASGLPCQGCRLLLHPTSTELSTDGYGEALSEPLAPGSYRVYRPRITHLGSSVVEQDDAEVRTVRVRRGKTVTVRFGELRRKLRIRFEPDPAAPGLGVRWSLSVRARRHVARYWAAADGSFVVDRPREEAVDLFLQAYDAATRSEVEIWQAHLAADFSESSLVLPLGSASVSGRVTREGEPLVGEWVRLKTLDNSINGSVKTRSDGTFRLPHLPVGIYAIAVGELNVKFVSLRAGANLDVGAFQLIPGGF